MAKKKTVGQLKKILWKHFALYIKLKESEDGRTCKCYTCQAVLEIGTSNCQAAHWLPKGAYGNHYFNEDNVKPGCMRCNCFNMGESEAFRRHLIEDIGEEAVEYMWNTRKLSGKRARSWYLENIEHYKSRVNELQV